MVRIRLVHEAGEQEGENGGGGGEAECLRYRRCIRPPVEDAEVEREDEQHQEDEPAPHHHHAFAVSIQDFHSPSASPIVTLCWYRTSGTRSTSGSSTSFSSQRSSSYRTTPKPSSA